MSNLTAPQILTGQPGATAGKRRLPAFNAASTSEVSANDSLQQRLNMLRESFADELDMLRKEAQQEGLAVGREKAAIEQAEARSRIAAEHELQLQAKLAELKKDVAKHAQLLARLVDSVQGQMLEQTNKLEPVVGQLTTAVIIKLLGKQLVDGDLLFAMAAQAVKEYRLSEPLRIKVAAADYSHMQSHHSTEPFFSVFEIDHELSPGDCLIDYGQGHLEAGIETQLAAIRALLTSPAKDRDHVGGA